VLMSRVVAGNGVFAPEELLLMHDVLDRACNLLQVNTKSDRAEDIAWHILTIYQGGIVDGAKLLDIVVDGYLTSLSSALSTQGGKPHSTLAGARAAPANATPQNLPPCESAGTDPPPPPV